MFFPEIAAREIRKIVHTELRIFALKENAATSDAKITSIHKMFTMTVFILGIKCCGVINKRFGFTGPYFPEKAKQFKTAEKAMKLYKNVRIFFVFAEKSA